MMDAFNLNNKTFRLLENSDHGAVNDQTIFHYQQKRDIVTATYTGGGVKEGQIIATFQAPDELDMRYHCIMDDDTLKAGKAIARMILNREGLIELHLDWEWIGESQEKGKSVYLETTHRIFPT